MNRRDFVTKLLSIPVVGMVCAALPTPEPVKAAKKLQPWQEHFWNQLDGEPKGFVIDMGRQSGKSYILRQEARDELAKHLADKIDEQVFRSMMNG